MDWTSVINWLSNYGWRILIIIIISVALYYLMHHFVPVMVQRTVSRSMKGRPKTAKKKRAETISSAFIQTGIVIISIGAIFTILATLEVNIGPALAGLGVAGIAIGFGAQSLVKDIFNGMFILLESQFGVGDWVKIAGVDGLVQEIGLRKTVLRDFDGTVHTIPNGEIKISSNMTKEWARVNMTVSVGYGEDLDHVIEVINRVGTEISNDPDWTSVIIKAPQVLRVSAFEDSGIAIQILGETKQMNQWAVMGEMRLRLKKAFDEEGIEIPWPHTKVFFGNSPADAKIKETTTQKPPVKTAAPEQAESKKREKRPIVPDNGGEG